jgi:hypothetical protein
MFRWRTLGAKMVFAVPAIKITVNGFKIIYREACIWKKSAKNSFL